MQTLYQSNLQVVAIFESALAKLTQWGRVTHLCVGNPTIIDSDNGLSPSRHQAIIWTNAGTFLIGTLGINFSETSIEIQTFSFKKMCFKVSSAKWRLFCLSLNVLTIIYSLWMPLDIWALRNVASTKILCNALQNVVWDLIRCVYMVSWWCEMYNSAMCTFGALSPLLWMSLSLS